MHEMPDPTTIMVPGSRLAEQRRAYGVTQRQLAARLGHHRNTIMNWEDFPAVDLRRQRLYLAACREIARGAA